MACLSSHTRSAGLALLIAAHGVLAACPATAPRTVPVVVTDGDLCDRAPDDSRCRPESTHERVELRNHLAGCTPGPRGAATFSLDGQVLATLAPGEHKTVRLPRGDVAVGVTVAPGDAEELVHLSLGGSGPVLVEAGCPAGRFAASGLAPLVLVGPEASCPPARVRASGLDFELGAGLTWTLLVPHGDHVIRFGGAAQTVSVGGDGAQLPAPTCGVQGQRRGLSIGSAQR